MGLEVKPGEPDVFPPPAEDVANLVLVKDWSHDEEVKAKRKLDLIIMPLLTLGFFCLRKCSLAFFVRMHFFCSPC